MIVRTRFVAMALLGAALAVTVPAFARQLREPKAHLVVDVPESWRVYEDGEYVAAAPKDESFHLRILGTDQGTAGEQQAESVLLQRLAKHLDNIQVSQHVKPVDGHDYTGSEIFGTGTEHDGKPAKFFAILMTDKKHASKGAFVLGSGTYEGFDRHQGGIHEALRTLRQY